MIKVYWHDDFSLHFGSQCLLCFCRKFGMKLASHYKPVKNKAIVHRTVRTMFGELWAQLRNEVLNHFCPVLTLTSPFLPCFSVWTLLISTLTSLHGRTARQHVEYNFKLKEVWVQLAGKANCLHDGNTVTNLRCQLLNQLIQDFRSILRILELSKTMGLPEINVDCHCTRS